jgi:multimeric flavodoxin WrbA
MMQLNNKINVLGICCSPRRDGNSQYLLEKAFDLSVERLKPLVDLHTYHIRGKKFWPCLGCNKCTHDSSKGECVIKDNFQELRDLWLAADVVIYSTPVYHYSVPGQIKCFLDRLGNSVNKRFQVSSPRFLKVVGTIAQGSHFGAGQEAAINFIIQHAVMKNCIPVSGDGWESYLGAVGWTANLKEEGAFKQLIAQKDADALVAVKASKSLVIRAIEMALIIRLGALAFSEYLNSNLAYESFMDLLKDQKPLHEVQQ